MADLAMPAGTPAIPPGDPARSSLTEFRTASAKLLIADMDALDYGAVTDVQLAHLIGRAQVVLGNLIETIEDGGQS